MKNERIDVLNSSTLAKSRIFDRILSIIRDPKAIPGKIKRRLLRNRAFDWNSNAEKLGAYSVIDGRHPPCDYDYVTRRTKEILYPLFKEQLDNTEKTLLDYGCGPGRFTGDLAEMIDGKAIGVDTTEKLIEIAIPHSRVEFLHIKNVFEDDLISSFDVIFICCVLGGINSEELPKITNKLMELLNDNGLLFIIESTGLTPTKDMWRIFTKSEIISLFPEVKLRPISIFHDAGQERTVFSGRKNHKDK